MKHLLARFIVALLLPASTCLHAADYRIDPAQSHADFGVRLFWLTTINGRFEHIDGDITLSAQRDAAVVNARITVDSITMSSDRFRRWVLAPEFFDAEHYPTIHFVSEPVMLAALRDGGELFGELTIRGVSRPAHFQLVSAPCVQGKPYECEIEVRGSIQRSDFGMTGHRTALSDKVDLGMTIRLAPPMEN
ncbi:MULTISPECIES: YceI family protein [Dyella]|uniref:Polyisoprenoid-binding protein n=2 Tax=Dyella TaxID=231454 RepID=A0A4V6N9Y2_9GAMM|nr:MULTISPECIES: YceI family protein [Dyella]TBR35798.1 polyisoprenoid-binding protein [Dyella terrae]TCI08654.1 polyisoprenoid-binding protein [Dyella soli]